MKGPFALAVSPTGASKTRADHPNIPLTPDEIAREAARCLEAGACMLHLHVRRADLSHSLEADDYRVALNVVRREVGQRMVIQITTEAGGKYSPMQQIELVKSMKPEAASVALCEIAGSENDISTAAEFFSWMQREHVISQIILYSSDEAQRYFELRRRGVIPEDRHWALFVLGRYTSGQASTPNDLLPFLELWNKHGTVPWMVCAFGHNEAACVSAAMRLGGHGRVGFENNLFLPDGSRAENNAQLVSVAAQAAHTLGVPLANADTLRNWFE